MNKKLSPMISPAQGRNAPELSKRHLDTQCPVCHKEMERDLFGYHCQGCAKKREREMKTVVWQESRRCPKCRRMLLVETTEDRRTLLSVGCNGKKQHLIYEHPDLFNAIEAGGIDLTDADSLSPEQWARVVGEVE